MCGTTAIFMSVNTAGLDLRGSSNLYDFYKRNPTGWPVDDPENWSLDNAQGEVRLFKFIAYRDVGETQIEALAFTEYGYNGTLTSSGLPCPPSGQICDAPVFE